MNWRLVVALAVTVGAGTARADELPAPYQMPALDARTSAAVSILSTLENDPDYNGEPALEIWTTLVLAPRLTWRPWRRLTGEAVLPVVLRPTPLAHASAGLGNLTLGLRSTTALFGHGLTVGGGASLTIATATGDAPQRMAGLFPAESGSLWAQAHVLRAHVDAAWERDGLSLQVQVGLDHLVRVDQFRDQTLARCGLAASLRLGATVTVLAEVTLFTDVLDEEWDEGYDVAAQLDVGFRQKRGRWTVGAHAAVPVTPDAYLGAAMDLTRSF